MHVLWDPRSGGECNRRPYMLDILLRDAVTTQEVARGIRSIHLKAVRIAAVSRHQTDIMEHGARVEKFRVKRKTTALTSERGEVVNAARVIEQQSRFCIAN